MAFPGDFKHWEPLTEKNTNTPVYTAFMFFFHIND